VQYVSTTGRAPATDLRTAVMQGLAPDGGLYLPSSIDAMPPDALDTIATSSPATAALLVCRRLTGGDLDDDALRDIVERAIDFPFPLVRLDDRTSVLELFHGPTLAFKDVGARFMAHLLDHLRPIRDPLTVLVATSGDTGGAVAHAFLGMPDTRVVILFPARGVSDRQARQFTTLGANAIAVAVNGSFDDCQRLVKRAFADVRLRHEVALTSANSVNIGRLLPQVVYYFLAWARHPGLRPPVFSTPCGNFGNLTAGLIAKRMGLPVHRFIAATNVNRIVPDFLETGVFTPRPSRRTISNAMDVGDPSNFARIMALYDGDADALRRDVGGSAHTDDETRACITDTFARSGYVLDPHTAVAYLALRHARAADRDARGIVLATAHPAKFAETVERAIGQAVPVPARLAERLAADPVVTSIEPRTDELNRILRS